MYIYTTLDGRALDLTGLNEEERAYFDRAYAAYRGGITWAAFSRMVEGSENPLLRATGGRITPAVSDHPLFQAVRDLEDRVGIAAGGVRAESDDDYARDPVERGALPAGRTGASAT